jgi:hypothetical protein
MSGREFDLNGHAFVLVVLVPPENHSVFGISIFWSCLASQTRSGHTFHRDLDSRDSLFRLSDCPAQMPEASFFNSIQAAHRSFEAIQVGMALLLKRVRLWRAICA